MECANRVVALELRDEDDLALVLDPEVYGLSAELQKIAHDAAPGVDQLSIAQKCAADLECLDADEPASMRLVASHEVVRLQRGQYSVRRRSRDTGALRDLHQRLAVRFGDNLQQSQTPIERPHGNRSRAVGNIGPCGLFLG